MKQTFLRATWVVLFAFAGCQAVRGAAAGNDFFTNRVTLTGTYVTTASSNNSATVETGEPRHGYTAGPFHSVWWTWTAPASGQTEINTAGSAYDTTLGVYTNRLAGVYAVTNLSLVASNDDFTTYGSRSAVFIPAVAGTAYQIAVDGYGGAVGAISLTLRMGPSVNLTTPVANAVFASPANITLTADAVASTGSVARVEFFQGTTKLGQATNVPFSMVWSNVASGVYSLTARATDRGNLSNTSPAITVTVSSNLPPTVAITSPTNGTSFPVPGPVTLTATATAVTGTIAKVEFFQGGTRLGEAISAPYSFVWSNMAAGNYVLTAKATDSSGGVGSSLPVNVTATAVPPSVAIVSPANGATLTSPGAFAVVAGATAAVGIVTKVEFYQGTTYLGQATEAPFSLVLSNLALGGYVLTARATDSFGGANTSAPVNITVVLGSNNPPVVALTSPAEGATFAPPANLALTATASDSDDPVSKVEFYTNGVKLASVTNAPYTFSWLNAPLGGYTLLAVATDTFGASATSAPVHVTVAQPAGLQWTAYNDHARGTGTASNVTAYTLPTTGSALGGPLTNFLNGQVISPNRVGVQISGAGTISGNTGSSGTPNAGTPADLIFGGKVDWASSALYFAPAPYSAAVTVTFTNLTPGRTYRFRGTAIRGNAYTGRWTLATLAGASSAVPAHLTGPGSPGVVTNGWAPYGDALAPLTQVAWNCGQNLCGDVMGWDQIVPIDNSFSVICSNYHWVAASSPLGSLEDNYCYAFSALRLEEFEGGPFVALTSPANGQVVSRPTNLVLTAALYNFTGAVSQVAFYAGATKLADVVNSPYTCTWTNPPEGYYQLTAVATDGGSLSVTSASVAVLVISNDLPLVSLTSPADGSAFLALSNLTLAASASDLYGISKVEFYDGAAKLGETSVTPYRLVWSGVAGDHPLVAVATDTYGLMATSSVVHLTLTNDLPPVLTITSPTNNATITASSAVSGFPITVSATDSDGTVARVEFFANAAKLGELTAAPFSFVWSNVAGGNYQLQAIATDNLGMRGTSAVVNVTVVGNVLPVVNLTSPANNATFTAPTNLLLAASASDGDGDVTNVEFYANAVQVGQDASSPYGVTWSSVPAGSYTLLAVAVDNLGGRATSAPVQITLNAPVSATGGLAFNGVDQYVTFGIASTLGVPTFTLEVWFNWTGGGVVGSSGASGVSVVPLISKGRGEADGNNRDGNYIFGIRLTDGVLAADFEEGATGSSPGLNHPAAGVTAVTPNVWHHAAVTYDGANWQLYLDGRLDSTTYVGQPPRSDSIQHAALGTALNSSGTPEGYFAGVLDEARIWNYARTALQITNNLSAQIPSATGLVGRWALDETGGSIAYDSSGNAVNGTLVNGPVWTNGYPFSTTIALTSPTNNALFATPANVPLSATVTGANPITNVLFYANTSLLGSRSAVPYSLVWSNAPVGSYQLKAVAYANTGLATTSAVVSLTVVNNDRPLVNLTAPANGATFMAPASLALQATASDTYGIQRVEFFADTTKLGETTAAPYQWAWSGVPAGSYQLAAIATDGFGLTATSAWAWVTVTNNAPPSVTLTTPTNNAFFDASGGFINVPLAALANDPDGVVAKVEFFANAGKVAESLTSPFNAQWSVAIGGSYQVLAVATDNVGLKGTSAVVNVTIHGDTPPVVVLTNPVNNATFGAPGFLSLGAAASDSDGTVTNVEFYAGTLFLGQTRLSPYQVQWTNAPAGEYLLRAVAVDNVGVRSTSAPVSISVIQPMVSQWVSYFDYVSGAGTGPNVLTVSDNTGSGYLLNQATGEQLPEFLSMSIAGTPSGTSGVEALVPGTPAYEVFNGYCDLSGYCAGYLGSDGESTSIFISNLDPQKRYSVIGTVNRDNSAYTTRITLVELLGAASLVPAHTAGVITNGLGTQQAGFISYNATGEYVSWTAIDPGADGVIEVKSSRFTNQTTYALGALRIEEFAVGGALVQITSPRNNATVVLPTNLVLTAVASGFGGTVTNLAFYNGTTKLGGVTAAPFNFPWTSVTPGTYTLRAVATDNTGLSVTSPAVRITVQNNLAPAIAILTPADNASFGAPADIAIEAQATDSDGAVTNVDLRANGVLLTRLTSPPYSFFWPGVPGGNYALTAVATDDHGAISTSSVTRVFVLATTAPTVSSFEPPAGLVSQLSQLTVNFDQPVTGVHAADLLVNGVPAAVLAGAGATYLFTFPSPPEGPVAVTWALNPGISNGLTTPQPFKGTLSNETALYTLVDTVPPTVARISPSPGATLPSFSQVKVTFSEPVAGVTKNALLLNGVAATKVSGSVAGPYLFEFAQPAAGPLQLTWATDPGIRDLAAARNRLVPTPWEYMLDPTGIEAGIVINEIMYHPLPEDGHAEYVELYNRGSLPVNLTGWRLNRAVNFTFTNTVMLPRGYLVVAADLTTFASKYPTVSNVLGNWSGQLANAHDVVELENALGQRVNSVSYADEGDWGIRQRGPFSPGWEWYAAHDGWATNRASGQVESGKSLELRNPALFNDNGQAWAASRPTNGTPGRANSVMTNDVPALILDVVHNPALPTAADSVAITARIVNEIQTSDLVATLYYRNASSQTPPAFSSMPMVDDGLHQDGAANDGVYGAILPPNADHTVIEFYVQAVDDAGATSTWPAPARQTGGTFAQTCNALYQVNQTLESNAFCKFYVILTEAERVTLANLSHSSDAEMNGTLITVEGSETQIRYNIGIRYRGQGTRGRTPSNYRINVPKDHLWNGLSELNNNSQFVHAQHIGSVVALSAGLPVSATRPVRLYFNGSNMALQSAPVNGSSTGSGFGMYVMIEALGSEWTVRQYPDDANGNAYLSNGDGWNARLDYRGTNKSSYSTSPGGYFKETNRSEDDWTDLINLCYALSLGNGPADIYVQAMRTNANIELWMRFFAVATLIGYKENGLPSGEADDYGMYRGVKDPRFVLYQRDYDTIFGQGDTGGNTADSIWLVVDRSGGNMAPVLGPFMHNNEFAQIYFQELTRQAATTFSPGQLGAIFDRFLGGWVTNQMITDMKTFAANRRAYVLSQIPTNFSLSIPLTLVNGYYQSTTPTVTLTGQANALETRDLKVNGVSATWSAWQGRWTNTVTLRPGLNAILVQTYGSNNVPLVQSNLTIWYNNGTTPTVGGTISSSTTWTAAGGPYRATSTVRVASGATLTLEAGTTLYLDSGVNVVVDSGGRLLAPGTNTAHIRFSRVPGTSANWGNVTFNGVPGSPESVLSYVDFEFNAASTSTACLQVTGGTVTFDHLTFSNTAAPYMHLDGASFVVSDCVFPTPTGAFEPLHGAQGIKTGGRGLFLRNFFGAANTYNDVIDFTGGNRPGSPILQVINNVFIGSGDDALDLDGTDTWVEGNIFLHIHKNGSPDTASGVSGGNDSGNTSEVTVVGNIFYDCDQAAMAKQGNFFTLLNNTIVHQTRQGGTDTDSGVVCVADEGTTEAAGMYLEGNIVYDAEQLVRNWTASLVTFTNNLMSLSWSGPGGGNVVAEPLFKHLPLLAETTNFTSWAQAQVMKDWLSLLPGSPALATGPNGTDRGAVLPRGVSVSGEPAGMTRQTSATLTVGLNRTGSGIPTAGWPAGSGYTHYRWRLDGGGWSTESPLSTPIALSGLGAGQHRVEVIGRNDAGLYQNDPVLGPDACVTASHLWTVNPNTPAPRLNEILAANQRAVPVNGNYPDLIELYNPAAVTLDLAGMSLTDDSSDPRKFVFPAGAHLDAGQFLVLYADSESLPAGYHLGFNLKKEGDDLSLFAADGSLLDSVSFGIQIPDYSVGRLADGQWALTSPSLGAANLAVLLGDPHTLKINEWLAAGAGFFPDDFIELFNPDTRPVNLAGLHLSDNAIGWPGRDELAPLSFIAGHGYAVFLADGQGGAGPNHLNFRLAQEGGALALTDSDLSVIDYFLYGIQTAGLTQGRSPDGSTNIVGLPVPTPGAFNRPSITPGSQLVLNEVMTKNITGLTNVDGSTPAWIELYNPTPSAINLANMSLSDVVGAPFRFVFPAGSSLGSGNYLVVLCDASQPASTNSVPRPNTGFGIGANGGAVYLFDQAGTLLDVINYGLQANDFSIGRVPSGGTNWLLTVPSPGGLNAAATLGDRSLLKLNEWMADDPNGSDWFEIFNPAAQPVNLSGLFLTDNLGTPASRQKFEIAPLSFLGTELYAYVRFWADNDPAAGPDHVNFALKKSGSSLGLYLPGDVRIDSLTYAAQQSGVSEGRLPDGAASWVRFPTTSSPNDANYLPLTNVVIHEVLSAPTNSSQLEQAVELRNLSSNSVTIGGWYLSNQKRHLDKFRIPLGTVLPRGGFIVFYENQFNANALDPACFRLDDLNGDSVYLASADTNTNLTGYRTEASFGPGEGGVSFGRYVNSVGNVDFPPLSQRTFGAAADAPVATFRLGAGATNAAPKVGPIVLSEIMYHPPEMAGADNARDEFIELYNSGSDTVPLFDPLHPTNTWRLRDAVSFTLPAGLSLAPNAYLVVVSFDPANDPTNLAAFRAQYPTATNALLVGPYSGKLANSDGKVELYKPGLPTNGTVPYILVERVHYFDVLPWPTGPDGLGASLNRANASAYGNDPANWLEGPPSPGGLSLPRILTQPASQEVAVGETVSFSAGVWSIAPVGYQWRFAGAVLPGETTSWLVLTNVQLAQAGVYDVLVTNRNGSLLSAPAVLTVRGGVVDSDGDGIPDAWMQLHFGHPTGSAADRSLANQDADGDGLTNLCEFLAGTDPRDASSTLRLISLGFRSGQGYVLQFQSVSNQAYGVKYTPALGGSLPWTTLTTLPAQPQSGWREVIDPTAGPGAPRFYRVETPPQ